MCPPHVAPRLPSVTCAGCQPRAGNRGNRRFGFRVLPSANPARPDRGFSPDVRRMLPWAFPSQGSLSSILAGPSGPPPPARLASSGSCPPVSAFASESRSIDDAPDPVVRAPLSGFLRLLRPWHSNAPASGLWVHLAGRPCLAARPRSALWKPARALLALSGLPMGATQRRLSAASERYNAHERCQTKK